MEKSKAHKKWYQLLRDRLSTNNTIKDSFQTNFSNFLGISRRSSQSFSMLTEVTLKEKHCFKEDMMSLFKAHRENFESPSGAATVKDKKERQAKTHELLKEVKIFIEKVDFRKNEYIQTTMMNIQAYLTNIENMLMA